MLCALYIYDNRADFNTFELHFTTIESSWRDCDDQLYIELLYICWDSGEERKETENGMESEVVIESSKQTFCTLHKRWVELSKLVCSLQS